MVGQESVNYPGGSSRLGTDCKALIFLNVEINLQGRTFM